MINLGRAYEKIDKALENGDITEQQATEEWRKIEEASREELEKELERFNNEQRD